MSALSPAPTPDAASIARNAVHLDWNTMLQDQVGAEHGLDPARVLGMQGRIDEIHDRIINRTGAGADFLGFLDLPYQGEEALRPIQEAADRLAALGDLHVVLGIGGSYLGSRAVLEALHSPYRNEWARAQRGNRPRVYFEGNNLDALSLQDILALLPDRPGMDLSHEATVNVISKSGGTIETAVAFRLFQHRLKQVYGADHARRIVATTDKAHGKLKALADAEGYATFVIPDDVGGRYSVLTPVGLLPAAVAGVDIRQLVAGARAMADRCKATTDLAKNPAYLYAVLQHLSDEAGRSVSLMTSWGKRLEFLGFWYDQLCSESLGKQGRGRVPVATVNTRDLHSRGQEIQEGPHNMVSTHLVVEEVAPDLAVPKDDADSDGLNYVAGKSIHQMLHGAYEGTLYAYAKAGRPGMTIRIPRLDAHALGQLFYLFELATVAEGYLMGINPMDQPGVEEYKKFMFGNLGRPDMAKYKAEFDARPKADPRYVC